MAIQQVHGIIPKEIIDTMMNNQENQPLETIVPTEIQNPDLNATESNNEVVEQNEVLEESETVEESQEKEQSEITEETQGQVEEKTETLEESQVTEENNVSGQTQTTEHTQEPKENQVVEQTQEPQENQVVEQTQPMQSQVVEQTKVINESEGVQPQVANSTRGDKKFTKLREKMVADALGVSINEMKTFINDYQSSLNGNSHMNDSREDRLRRARGIYTVQRGANNNDKKDTIRGAVSSIGSLVIGTTMLADFITLPVKAAICLIGVGYNIYRYNKRKQGNRFDEYAKQEDYEKQLSIFFEDAKRLDDAILRDRETLENLKNTMSRREYKAFRQEYLKNKVAELQIESPFVRDKLVQSGLQQMPNSINKVLNVNKSAEVIA